MGKIIFFLIFCYIGIAQSQNNVNNNDKYFYATVSFGTAINDPIGYYFYRETEGRIINPGVYTNIGIEYGPINILELTQLYFCFSAAYTKVSTSEFQLENFPSKAKLIIETFPILFWGKLQTNTKLSPFVEIGIGLSKLNFIERYSYLLNGTSFNYWSFGYGFGAGVNYKLSERLNLSFAAQSLVNERNKMVENDRGHLSGINIRNLVIPISLKIDIKL